MLRRGKEDLKCIVFINFVWEMEQQILFAYNIITIL